VNGIIQPEPEEVLARRFHLKNNRSISEILVRWASQSPNDATSEEYYALKQAYPHLVGKVL
jgi:hypothetical protein